MQADARTQTQLRMHEVMIKVKTFARFQNHMDMLGLPIAAHGVRQAVLQRAEDGNQAGRDATLTGDLPGEGLLAGLAAGQITERAARFLRCGIGGGFDSRGQSLSKIAEILDQDTIEH